MTRRLKPVHPGEILLEDFMKPMKLSMNKLALGLRVPTTRIAEIAHARRGVTPNTALRLARYFNTTPEFWVNLQTRYDLDRAKDEQMKRIKREVQPLSGAATARVA